MYDICLQTSLINFVWSPIDRSPFGRDVTPYEAKETPPLATVSVFLSCSTYAISFSCWLQVFGNVWLTHDDRSSILPACFMRRRPELKPLARITTHTVNIRFNSINNPRLIIWCQAGLMMQLLHTAFGHSLPTKRGHLSRDCLWACLQTSATCYNV